MVEWHIISNRWLYYVSVGQVLVIHNAFELLSHLEDEWTEDWKQKTWYVLRLGCIFPEVLE